MNQPPSLPSSVPQPTLSENEKRRWWDRGRIIVPLLILTLPFFVLLWPVGLLPLWVGKRFSKNWKIALSSPHILIMMVVAICLNLPKAPDTNQSAPRRVNYLIPHTILRNASTTKKGQWQVEVDLVDGRLPTRDELEFLSKSLAKKAGGYDAFERFFFEFYFPGMATKNGGSRTAYGLVKLDPSESSSALVRIFADNSYNWPIKFQSLPVPKGNW